MTTTLTPSFTYRMAATEEDFAAARQVEYTVFAAYFNNDPEELEAGWAHYAPASEFVLTVAGEGVPDCAPGTIVGVGRVIRPTHRGSKTFSDVTAEPWGLDLSSVAQEVGLDLERTWDIASLAFLPIARSPKVSLGMFAFFLQYIHAADASGWMAVLDCQVHHSLLSRGVDLPVLPGAFPAPYDGSPASIPVYGVLPRQRQATA